jgi:Tfp pilus assembly PilM family ATPase
MFRFFRSPVCPIGIDIDDDRIKLVQLDRSGKTISLIAGGSKDKPAEIEAGSSDWQQWVIETIRELTADGKFKGKDVIASLPASEVFIDHLKIPKAENDKLADILISQIKQKLTFDAKQAVVIRRRAGCYKICYV